MTIKIQNKNILSLENSINSENPPSSFVLEFKLKDDFKCNTCNNSKLEVVGTFNGIIDFDDDIIEFDEFSINSIGCSKCGEICNDDDVFEYVIDIIENILNKKGN
jgi:hypothetical protein